MKQHLHKPARAQSWPTADADVRTWVTTLVDALRSDLNEQIVGAYLHGSLAMGCYYKPKSDLDFLAVVRAPLSVEVRRRVGDLLLAAHERRPTTGGLEASVVTESAARHFVHPMPYEVHFSSSWEERIREHEVDFSESRTDPDLAAHITVARERGISLLGPRAKEIFGKVPLCDYQASIEADFDWIVEDDNLVSTPFYGVLNACRVLMVLEEGEGCVPSKEEAAAWAIGRFPAEHVAVVEQALACYRSGSVVDESQRRRHGHDWDEDALTAFRDYARRRAR